MPARLTAIPFTKDDLHVVADFNCGDDPWARYVTSWIQGRPNGVLDALDAGTEVWLYLTEQNEIVGFGSLGTTEWHYPDPYPRDSERKRIVLSLIPAYAVQIHFHKQPAGDWRQHYSSEILVDLINEATQRWLRDTSLAPLLGLFVDDRNLHAIRHYENHGFIKYGKPIKERGQRMLLNLPVEAAQREMSDAALRQDQPCVERDTPATPSAGTSLTFEQAVSTVLNAPLTPEQQAKKAARKARAEERKKHNKPKHGR